MSRNKKLNTKSNIEKTKKQLSATAVISIVLLVILGGILFVAYGIANSETEVAIPCLIIAWGLAIIIGVNLSIAKRFYSVAVMKGHQDPFYLKLAYYIPLAGYLLVVALPDRSKVIDSETIS